MRTNLFSRDRVNPITLLFVKLVALSLLLSFPLARADDDPPPPEDIPNASEQAPFSAPDVASPPNTPTAEAPTASTTEAAPLPTTLPDTNAMPTVEATMTPPAVATQSSSGEISTQVFDVNVNQRSNSMRVYLLDYRGAPADIPAEGKVLLLKNDSGPAMGVLVLKSDAANNQLIVKKVKSYPPLENLEPGQKLSAVEKTGDLPSQSLPAQDKAETTQDKVDVKELTPPEPEQAPKKVANHSPVDLEDASADITSKDSVNLDNYSNWLTLEFGLFRNVDASQKTTALYAAGGVRYGVTVGKRILFSKPHLQDSLVLEAGVFYYQIVNFTSTTLGDNYSIVPVIPALRYNIALSEEFTFFFYGGMMFNFVMTSSNPVATVQSNLGAAIPAFGTGLFFQLGPNWHARLDLGYDMIGLGIVLRF